MSVFDECSILFNIPPLTLSPFTITFFMPLLQCINIGFSQPLYNCRNTIDACTPHNLPFLLLPRLLYSLFCMPGTSVYLHYVFSTRFFVPLVDVWSTGFCDGDG